MNATLDEVKEAAKAADAHDFIKRLPMQYYTFLEEAGNGLSGGEKQRIALARAFLKQNEFYILDESTSNLDFATENIIFDMIYNKFRKKSMLIIAHRLATVKNCDAIIVLLLTGKKLKHFFGRFAVKLLRPHAHPILLVHESLGLNAQQHVLSLRVLLVL